MATEYKAIRERKISGNISIPVSFRHPTTDGGDRQWVGYVREIYTTYNTCVSDEIVFRGCFISDMNCKAFDKTILLSLLSNFVDLRSGRVIDHPDDILEYVLSSAGVTERPTRKRPAGAPLSRKQQFGPPPDSKNPPSTGPRCQPIGNGLHPDLTFGSGFKKTNSFKHTGNTQDGFPHLLDDEVGKISSMMLSGIAKICAKMPIIIVLVPFTLLQIAVRAISAW